MPAITSTVRGGPNTRKVFSVGFITQWVVTTSFRSQM